MNKFFIEIRKELHIAMHFDKVLHVLGICSFTVVRSNKIFIEANLVHLNYVLIADLTISWTLVRRAIYVPDLPPVGGGTSESIRSGSTELLRDS